MMTTASAMRKPGLWQRLFGGGDPPLCALYAAIVVEARRPLWYRDAAVPDSVDGRFDMVALVLSLVLLRLEHDALPNAAVELTERFVDDMDGQMRQSGFGDLVVGKQVGGIMAALGGRLGAYRGGVSYAALERNLWRGRVPDPQSVGVAQAEVDALQAQIEAVPIDRLLAGQLG